MTMSEDDTNVPDARKRAWGAVYKPRYSGIATFMRQELREDPEDWDGIEIGMIGVPFDGAVTNRPGARHGPRALRDQSTLMGRMNHQTKVRPYDWARLADLGDVMIEGVYDLNRAVLDIEEF
jgi:guanidinopropionase